MNITWLGLGKLGKPCAEVMSQKGYAVKGYDLNLIQSPYIQQCPTIEDAVINADIVFVAVPTPHDSNYDGSAPTANLEPKDFDYSIVKSVLDEADAYMHEDQLLVLISTVLPGTVRRELKPLVTNTRFVYNPYLIAMGSVAYDMVNPEMVMIGTEDGSATGDAKQLVEFYKTVMENNPRYVIGTWDECEAIKVFYNTFISTKIGLVNMIQDVAERQGNIDVDVVTQALAQSTMRITSSKYMKAGMGDGGSCHPRDNIALRYMAQKLELNYDLFGSVMNAREKQAENMAKSMLKYGSKIQFSSNSYKAGVEYIDGSYSLLVQYYVKSLGGNIVHTDPDVYVIVHEGDEVPDNVLVFDPWRTYNGPNKFISYGKTK